MANWLNKILGLTKKEEQLSNKNTIGQQFSQPEILPIKETKSVNHFEELKAKRVVEAEMAAELVLQNLKEYKRPSMDLISSATASIFSNLLSAGNFELPILWSIEKEIIVKDLTELKNILITGSQAKGKTTFLNQLIFSMILVKYPWQLKMILFDYSGIQFESFRALERSFLSRLKWSDSSIISNLKDFSEILGSISREMDARLSLFREVKVSNIEAYNRKLTDKILPNDGRHNFMSYFVIVIDDLSPYTLQNGNIDSLLRILREGYKAGVFSIISSGSISGQAIPGEVLSSIENRIVFHLNGREEYRKFFDTIRFEVPYLIGKYVYKEKGVLMEGFSYNLPIEDIESVVDCIRAQETFLHPYLLSDSRIPEIEDFDLSDRDALFEDAALLIVQNQIGSTSLLQRRMKLGYNRAGRLMDQLESAGIVGPNLGAVARTVLIKTESQLQELLNSFR